MTSIQYGYHWLSQCQRLSYNTVRHNAVCGCFRDMYKKLGWLAQDGETAHWVVGAPDKRPYDVVAQNPDSGEWIGIPTRKHTQKL